VTPNFATDRLKVKGKSPAGFAMTTMEKLCGVLKTIREPNFTSEEHKPPLTMVSTAYTDTLVIDQLGATGLAALYACFAHSWPPGESPGPKTPKVPAAFERDNPGKWYHPEVITISNSYPGVFTLTLPTQLEQEIMALGIQRPKNRWILRSMIGTLIRTGYCADTDQVTIVVGFGNKSQAVAAVGQAESHCRAIVSHGRDRPRHGTHGGKNWSS